MLKYCSDTLCLPEGFGKHVCCPFCRHNYVVQPDSCLLGKRHLVQCDSFSNFILNLLKDRDLENLLYPIKKDKSLLLVRLVNALPSLNASEIKSTLHLFAIAALATGYATANPFFSRLQLADSVRQRILLLD